MLKVKRIQDLTPAEAEQIAPMAAAMRSRGIEPTYVGFHQEELKPSRPLRRQQARRDQARS